MFCSATKKAAPIPERDVGVQNLRGNRKVDLVPQLVVEAFNELTNGHPIILPAAEPRLPDDFSAALQVGDQAFAGLDQLVGLDAEHGAPSDEAAARRRWRTQPN